MIIGIIGGGASGMAAAIAAAQNQQNRVLVFERQARVGRKLQATGNGRCNLSNLYADEAHFHGEDPAFVGPCMEKFGVQNTLNWFSSLGLYTVAEPSGRIYPYSDQANSVVDILRFALEKENITLYTACEVGKVKRLDAGFSVEAGDESYFCDRLIIACGGLAGTKLGGSMAGYKLLRSLGHKCTRLRPTLVQLKSSWKGCTALKGVRANCCVTICKDGVPCAQSLGELQITEYGLSGPVIFEISRDVCQGAGSWTAQLNFLPEYSPEALRAELMRRKARNLSAEELLTGILHNRLGRVLTQAAGVQMHSKTAELSDAQIAQLCDVVFGFEVELTDTMGMDSAQVTAGGIVTAEFDPATMQSRLVPGLYACGEVLDVDGDCGGYNLQWAWSSGRLAGESAGGIYDQNS